MTKVLSLRVDDELAAWADEYAKSRGVSRTDLLVEGLRSFKADCETGVPEIREAARRQSSVAPSEGTGDCPKRARSLGHVWMAPNIDPRRACEFCGAPGREYFQQATAARTDLFDRLQAPASSHGKAKTHA